MRAELATERSSLERRADELRDQLMAMIGLIERRARDATNVKLQWSRHRRLIGLSLIGVAAALGYAAYRLDERSLRRTSRRRRARLLAFRRIWRNPDALLYPAEPPVVIELARKLVVGSLGFMGLELMKRGIRRVLAAQAPPPSRLGPSRSERPIPRLLER